MREPPAEHLDQAWPGIGRTAIQQVADERTSALAKSSLRWHDARRQVGRLGGVCVDLVPPLAMYWARAASRLIRPFRPPRTAALSWSSWLPLPARIRRRFRTRLSHRESGGHSRDRHRARRGAGRRHSSARCSPGTRPSAERSAPRPTVTDHCPAPYYGAPGLVLRENGSADVLGVFDGRYLSTEVAAGFTGRPHDRAWARGRGTVSFRGFRYLTGAP
jgi:hypothetical protein